MQQDTSKLRSPITWTSVLFTLGGYDSKIMRSCGANEKVRAIGNSLIQIFSWLFKVVGFTLFGVMFMGMTVFAMFVVFFIAGRDYDAVVIAAGFSGLGLGATPVAIANMNAITDKYGPSFKAFLVIPLVGAFFVDLLNALSIKLFIGLPLLQTALLPGTQR